MSKPKPKVNPTFPLGTALWVKLLKRVWWPGTVVDPITIPQELKDYVKKVEPISAVVKFEKDKEEKYHVVGLTDVVYLYSCDRKMEFVEKGFSLYQNQLRGLPVIGNFDMNFFMAEVILLEERLIGGDIDIFEKLTEKKETVKSIVREFFTPTNSKKSKKKEVEKKSLPSSKPPKTIKTPNQPKPKPVSKPKTSTQSQVGKTYKPTTSTGYSCHSQIGCTYTTNRYDNLKRHMAIHKNDTDVVTTKKSSTSSTSNKRKNLKNKSLEVKKQKLQEELLKDWDNDGEDEDEELNTSKSSNVAQSSNEEGLQTLIDVQSSSNVVQSLNEEIVQTKSDVLSSSDVAQSSNEEVIPTSKVVSSKNDVIPTISEDISRNSEVQETSTSSPNQVFDFNENDSNTPVVELRKGKSDCSSTLDNDISESFESKITPEFINNTIFDLVKKSTDNCIDIDKPHEIHSNEHANEIDNQTKSTELLLKKTVSTLDQINNLENSLSCISSSINNSDAKILTEDNNVVIGVSELSESGSLNKPASPYKDIDIETNGVGDPLVENMSTETEDRAIVKENTNDKEIVTNDKEVNQFNGTAIDKNMPIENSCSVDCTTTEMDCEVKNTNLMHGTADPEWNEGGLFTTDISVAKKASYVEFEETAYMPSPVENISVEQGVAKPKLYQGNTFQSELDTKKPSTVDYIFGNDFQIFLPIDYDGPYPTMEELTPNVNPVTEACQRATMEHLFLDLNIIDKWT